MCNELYRSGIGYQRISRNSRNLLIRAGKSAVDNDDLSAAVYRRFPFFYLYGYMSVYDMPFVGIDAEFAENTLHRLFIVAQTIIGIFFLRIAFFIREKISLEGRHFILSVKRRVLIRPNEPHDVPSVLPFPFVGRISALAYPAFERIVQRSPGIDLSRNFHAAEAAVPVERDTAVIEKIPGKNPIHTSAGEQKLDVSAEFFAAMERFPQFCTDSFFSFR